MCNYSVQHAGVTRGIFDHMFAVLVASALSVKTQSASHFGDDAMVEELRDTALYSLFRRYAHGYAIGVVSAAAPCMLVAPNIMIRKQVHVHNTVLGHQPKQLMTDGQEEALKSHSAARSELVGIRNALHGLPQEVRKRYFKNERIMTAWIEGVNYLIQHWDTIKEKFGG